QVALRDVDVLALLEITDAPAVDRTPHRFADLRLVATQEALAVADRLVLAGEPSIDDLLEHGASFRSFSAPAGTTRRAGAPASACSPSGPSGSRSPRACGPRRRSPWR